MRLKNAIFAAWTQQAFRVGTLPYFEMNIFNHTRTKQLTKKIKINIKRKSLKGTFLLICTVPSVTKVLLVPTFLKLYNLETERDSTKSAK